MSELNKHFNINYENYKNYIHKPEDGYEINGKNLVQFLIRLPYYIPVKDGSSISVYGEDKSLKIFLFNSVEFESPIFTSTSKEDTICYDKKYTIVEMVYISEKELDLDKEESTIFNELIDKLNEIILSILIKMKFEYMYRINVQMLETCVLYRCIDLTNGKEIISRIFILNDKIEVYDNLILEDQMIEMLQFYHSAIFTKGNPFVTSEELILSAIRQRDNGFNKESIMLCQSSVESFLRTLYKEFLIIEENNETEIKDKIDNTPFISIVKKEMHPRLGGNWNINTYGDVGNWYRDTYELRNKVSHGGYTPSLEEARLAVQRAKQLRIYVIQLLKSKGNKYKDIVKYLVKDK